MKQQATLSTPRWGTSLITFFHPTFFDLQAETSYEQFLYLVSQNPRPYFDKMLDGARDASLEGLEFAPEPGGWEGALHAYGSATGVRAALDERGLQIGSSYMNGMALLGPALADQDAERQADQSVESHARFINEAGGSTIVMGTLPRLDFGPEAYNEVPLSIFERVADQLNRLGRIAGRYDCTIALHTDAYSLCARDADIDTMMSLTDTNTIGLCLDSGHVSLDGGDAVSVMERHAARVPVAHWKDADAPLDGRTLQGDFLERHAVMMSHFRWIGEGLVDWDRFMHVVREADWGGWAHAEFDFAPTPVQSLRTHVGYCRNHVVQRRFK